MPHRQLSAPVEVLSLDLQRRVDSVVGLLDAETAPGWEHDETLQIPIADDGVWNGVAFWFEASSSNQPKLEV